MSAWVFSVSRTSDASEEIDSKESQRETVDEALEGVSEVTEEARA